MKGNHEATMSLKALAHKVLAGNQAGNCKATALENLATFEATLGRKLPKKVAYSVARIEQNCQGCQYHDTGPAPFGRGVIQWCGPWRHANGDTHWLNAEEWNECPLDIKRLATNGHCSQK
jgi:hypothetical protein